MQEEEKRERGGRGGSTSHGRREGRSWSITRVATGGSKAEARPRSRSGSRRWHGWRARDGRRGWGRGGGVAGEVGVDAARLEGLGSWRRHALDLVTRDMREWREKRERESHETAKYRIFVAHPA